MKKYCIAFQNSYGKMGFIIEAESSEEALKKVLEENKINSYFGVEAIQIVQ